MPSTRFVIIDGQLHYKLSDRLVFLPPKLQDALDVLVKEFFPESVMGPPSNPALPFFAYGLFKPGQLGFDSLRNCAKEVKEFARIEGALFERDGVPLFYDGPDCPKVAVDGALITFFPEQAAQAYETITRLEPEKQYLWGTKTTTDGAEANVLVAKSLKGAYQLEEHRWDGSKDPILACAPEMALSIAENASGVRSGETERLLSLQMAYMLLWTAIERYTSLRYHLRKSAVAKIMRMTDEPAFRKALLAHVQREDIVYSTDAGTPEKLLRDNPKKSLKYYYQVRCNATHRGKAMSNDVDRLEKCIGELARVFIDTRNGAFEECKCHRDAEPVPVE